MEFRKIVLMNLFAGQQWRNRHREQTYRYGDWGRDSETCGGSNVENYITICKIESQWEFAVCLGKHKQGLCVNLEGWVGREMEGKFKREGTYVYLWLIHIDV